LRRIHGVANEIAESEFLQSMNLEISLQPYTRWRHQLGDESRALWWIACHSWSSAMQEVCWQGGVGMIEMPRIHNDKPLCLLGVHGPHDVDVEDLLVDIMAVSTRRSKPKQTFVSCDWNTDQLPSLLHDSFLHLPRRLDRHAIKRLALQPWLTAHRLLLELPQTSHGVTEGARISACVAAPITLLPPNSYTAQLPSSLDFACASANGISGGCLQWLPRVSDNAVTVWLLSISLPCTIFYTKR